MRTFGYQGILVRIIVYTKRRRVYWPRIPDEISSTFDSIKRDNSEESPSKCNLRKSASIDDEHFKDNNANKSNSRSRIGGSNNKRCIGNMPTCPTECSAFDIKNITRSLSLWERYVCRCTDDDRLDVYPRPKTSVDRFKSTTRKQEEIRSPLSGRRLGDDYEIRSNETR